MVFGSVIGQIVERNKASQGLIREMTPREKKATIQRRDGNPLFIAPVNGFFCGTGSQIHSGISGAFRISDRNTMGFNLGLVNYLSPYTGGFDSMMFGQIPFYAAVRFNYRIGR